MFLLGFRRKLTALALCKSIASATQWFKVHHRNALATIQNPVVYRSGARVGIFSTLVPRLIPEPVFYDDSVDRILRIDRKPSYIDRFKT